MEKPTGTVYPPGDDAGKGYPQGDDTGTAAEGGTKGKAQKKPGQAWFDRNRINRVSVTGK